MKTKAMPMQVLGEFEVKSGKLRATDPCYDLKTWCAGDFKARNGRWTAGAVRAKAAPMDERVMYLGAAAPGTSLERLMEMAQEPGILQDSGIDVGVDSGQCGLFDSAAFAAPGDEDALKVIVDGHPDQKFMEGLQRGRDNGLFYAACCALTCADGLNAGIVPSGCVSESGFGDGSYRCVLLLENGEAVGAVLVYEDAEEEEEEEDDSQEREDPQVEDALLDDHPLGEE